MFPKCFNRGDAWGGSPRETDDKNTTQPGRRVPAAGKKFCQCPRKTCGQVAIKNVSVLDEGRDGGFATKGKGILTSRHRGRR